jgi:hypothetical protein
VLHTSRQRRVFDTTGSALTHHPHVHMIVLGGGLSLNGNRGVASKPGFFLHVRVLSRLFRRLFIEGLIALHWSGELTFFGDLTGLSKPQAFEAYLAQLRKTEWVVYAKPPFGGPEAVLAYLSRYTHRVTISNSRLISADANTVAFQWKDYRVKSGDRWSVMRLPTYVFIRRFLIHVLPDRFHRIRHYGLLASAQRKANIAKARTLLGAKTAKQDDLPAAEVIPLTFGQDRVLKRLVLSMCRVIQAVAEAGECCLCIRESRSTEQRRHDYDRLRFHSVSLHSSHLSRTPY